MRRRKTWMLLALCLGLCMALTGALAAEETSDFAALPTPTPEPPMPQETASPAPEAPQTETPADPPETTESPTPQPSVTPTAEPEETVPATQAPTPEPTEASPETTLPPDAPVCKMPGCKHIGTDERGEVVGICPLGRWLIGPGSDVPQEHSAPTQLILVDGENYIYRGGAYQLSGGGKNARLYVRGGQQVQLALTDTDLLTLKLNAGSQADITFTGRSTLQTLAAPGAAIALSGTGSLTVKNNLNCESLTVGGGSVALPDGAVSGNGRVPVRFEAEGVTRVTVDGQFLTDALPDSHGALTLWLPPVRDGQGYTAICVGNTLEITRN